MVPPAVGAGVTAGIGGGVTGVDVGRTGLFGADVGVEVLQTGDGVCA